MATTLSDHQHRFLEEAASRHGNRPPPFNGLADWQSTALLLEKMGLVMIRAPVYAAFATQLGRKYLREILVVDDEKPAADVVNVTTGVRRAGSAVMLTVTWTGGVANVDDVMSKFEAAKTTVRQEVIEPFMQVVVFPPDITSESLDQKTPNYEAVFVFPNVSTSTEDSIRHAALCIAEERAS